MKKNKKMIVIGVLLIAITLLGVGTVAYFRRTVTGSLKGPTGNLTLVVNNADSVLNETFSVTLQRSEEEPYIYPDDSGTFDINVDVTGSTSDVLVTFTVERTNLPDNLKFYLDEEHTKELYNYGTVVKRSDSMTMTLPVYWYWDGSVDDYNDSEFINQVISANIKVSAAIAMSLHSHLMSQEYTLDTDVNFSSNETGNYLMMKDGTQNDEYPVIYYRGKVTNNNVIYNDFCWMIVRTTETGGVKLIYNGKVNEFGGCNNYSGIGDDKAETMPMANENTSAKWNQNASETFIDERPFNMSFNSPVYAGYMYNDTNLYFADGTFDISGYKSHLEDNTIDSESGRHTQNLYDSRMKHYIDLWYHAYFENSPTSELLEDTVWCNDRSVTSETYTLENFANRINDTVNHSAYTRIYESDVAKPSLTCNRIIDAFTVSEENGNGDLTYPIGLLTIDEVNMAGIYNDENFVLNYLTLLFKSFWTISPSRFFYSSDTIMTSVFNNSRYAQVVTEGQGIRPAISLNSDAHIVVGVGDGSFERPYLINLTEYIMEDVDE